MPHAPGRITRTPVAPAWHTIVFLALMLGASVFSAVAGHIPAIVALREIRALRYGVGFVGEWLYLAFIWYGIRLRGVTLAELIGGRWSTVGDVLRDAGRAIAFLIVSWIILAVGRIILGATTMNQSMVQLIPRTPGEVLLFVGVAVTAGVCEEIMCRGYVMRQFHAWTGSATVALIAQGVIFGGAHGYQGPSQMVLLSIFGCLFGWLAQRQQSLRPGIIAHVLQDVAFGVIGFLLVGRNIRRA